MSRIAVLIPALNEETTIAKVITDWRNILIEAGHTVEVVVCDNGSTDATATQAEQAGATVVAEPRRGKGNAMRALFGHAEAECYIMVDADDTYEASAGGVMADAVLTRKADMVIGERLSGSYFTENKRPLHGVGNRLVRALTNKMFHAHLLDIMSGCRAFSPRFVATYPVMVEGFEIETDMTIHALDKRLKIVEIDVPYRDRGADSKSKLNTYADGLRVLKTIFSLVRDYRPMLFFSWAAVLVALLAIIALIPVLVEYWHTGLVPRFPTLIAAGFALLLSMLLFVVGLILDVIARNRRADFELRLHRQADGMKAD